MPKLVERRAASMVERRIIFQAMAGAQGSRSEARNVCEYESVVKQFLPFLGKRRRKRYIAAITIRDVAVFRDDLAGRLSIGTGQRRRTRPVRDDDQKRRRGQLGDGSKHARSRPRSVLSVAPNRSS